MHDVLIWRGDGHMSRDTLRPDDGLRGTYVLIIAVQKACSIRFGHFNTGRPIAIPTGRLLYVGSAMGAKGPSSLPRRTLRHTTRSGEKAPHPIQRVLLAALPEQSPPNGKKLHWHIDYLLDDLRINLTHIFLLPGETSYEILLADAFNAHPATSPLAAGLGASDHRGSSHLLRISDLLDVEWVIQGSLLNS